MSDATKQAAIWALMVVLIFSYITGCAEKEYQVKATSTQAGIDAGLEECPKINRIKDTIWVKDCVQYRKEGR